MKMSRVKRRAENKDKIGWDNKVEKTKMQGLIESVALGSLGNLATIIGTALAVGGLLFKAGEWRSRLKSRGEEIEETRSEVKELEEAVQDMKASVDSHADRVDETQRSILRTQKVLHDIALNGGECDSPHCEWCNNHRSGDGAIDILDEE